MSNQIVILNDQITQLHAEIKHDKKLMIKQALQNNIEVKKMKLCFKLNQKIQMNKYYYWKQFQLNILV